MKLKVFCIAIGAVLLALAWGLPVLGWMVSASYEIPIHVFDGAGGQSSSASFDYIGSTGQSTPMGLAESASFRYRAGYIPQLASFLAQERLLTALAFIRHKLNDNQYLNIYEAPVELGGEINPLLAADSWIGNVGTGNEITHVTGGDIDGDGYEELILIRHMLIDDQYLNVYDAPDGVDGDMNPLLASDSFIGKVGTDSEITHVTAGDADGDGTDELIFIRHRLNDNQYLHVYDIPTGVGGEIDPLVASDLWIGNIGTRNEITHMAAGDMDGDGVDELIFIRDRQNDNQYLNIYAIPTSVGSDINPLLASDLWIGNFGTSTEITHMVSGDTDGDGTDELIFIRHRTNDNQYLHIYGIPTVVEGEINPLLASDIWIGNIGTNNEITHMAVIAW